MAEAWRPRDAVDDLSRWLMLHAGMLPAPPMVGEVVRLNLSEFLNAETEVKGTVLAVANTGMVDLYVEAADVVAYGACPYAQPSDGACHRWLR